MTRIQLVRKDLEMTRKKNLVCVSLLGVVCACAATNGQTVTPTVTSFNLNLTGIMGSSNDQCINDIVSVYEANVQRVRHNDDDVYVNATGIPSYPVGPFPGGNPSMATDRNWIFRIPKSPTEETGTKTTTPLGPIGVYVNGVPIYNARDGMSFMNQGIWNQNAVTNEGGVLPGSTNDFDANLGHSNPVMGGATVGPCPTSGTTFVEGEYHHHQRPISLMTQLGDDGSAHSPIVGWAFDGFPVYGPYGNVNTNGTGGVKRMESGYSLIGGFRPNPMMDPTSPGGMYDGTYVEDYEFTGGGDLDVHNGHTAVTPEYPSGIYHYHATINVDGEPGGSGAGDSTGAAYPYIVGPQYFGVAAMDNFITGLVEGDVPGDVIDYIPCDFDADGACDIDDIDTLIMEIVAGTNSPLFDLTGDGLVDLADRDQWLADAGAMNLMSGNPYLLGDSNLDGTVDGLDFFDWNSNKFATTGKWSLADWTADGTTDGQDFFAWNANKFTSADGAAIPEPSTALSLVITMLVCAGIRRSRAAG